MYYTVLAQQIPAARFQLSCKGDMFTFLPFGWPDISNYDVET